MKAIVLLSGGLDSAVAAAMAKEQGGEFIALSFNYYQRHRKEVECSYELAKYYEWAWNCYDIRIPAQSALIDTALWRNQQALSELGMVVDKPNVNEMVRGLPASFVPGRNLIFLSYAASLAYQVEADTIVGGWNAIDYSGYPDCRLEFLVSTELAINHALGGGTEPDLESFGLFNRLRIYHPLVFLNKKEIINEGIRLNVPFELTWSCYEGGEKPCGVCGSCNYRRKGFEEAGVKDPLEVGND
jgi:7-cyano-7-deazaguanine synthase